MTLGKGSTSVTLFMRKPIAFFTLLLTLAAPVLPSTHAAVTYRAGEGWSSDEENSGEAESTASAQFRKAEELESHGERKKALGAYKLLLKKWPKSGVAPVAQLRIGDLYVSLGDSERGFDAYGKYIKTYPSGQEFEQAVEGQFNIATGFMEGERRKVFGVKTFPSMTRAQEMFADILKSAPYSKWAALSQYNIGRCLEKQTKYKDAIAAYQNTVDQYPADEIAADAQYQIGYIQMSLVRDGSNDQGGRERAREAFEDFILRFPKSEKVPQAEENIRFLGGVDVKKTLNVAQFYEKTSNYKAAVIYYDEVSPSRRGRRRPTSPASVSTTSGRP